MSIFAIRGRQCTIANMLRLLHLVLKIRRESLLYKRSPIALVQSLALLKLQIFNAKRQSTPVFWLLDRLLVSARAHTLPAYTALTNVISCTVLHVAVDLNGSHYLLAAFSAKSQSSTSTELLACRVNQNDVQEVSRKDISDYCYGVTLQVCLHLWLSHHSPTILKISDSAGPISSTRSQAKSSAVSKQNRSVQWPLWCTTFTTSRQYRIISGLLDFHKQILFYSITHFFFLICSLFRQLTYGFILTIKHLNHAITQRKSSRFRSSGRECTENYSWINYWSLPVSMVKPIINWQRSCRQLISHSSSNLVPSKIKWRPAKALQSHRRVWPWHFEKAQPCVLPITGLEECQPGPICPTISDPITISKTNGWLLGDGSWTVWGKHNKAQTGFGWDMCESLLLNALRRMASNH